MKKKENEPTEKYRQLAKNVIFWVVIVSIAIIVAQFLYSSNNTEIELSYNEFLKLVDEGKVEDTVFKGRKLSGTFSSPYSESFGEKILTYDRYFLFIPFDDPSLVGVLKEKDVRVVTRSIDDGFWNIIIRILPWLLIPLLYFFFIRQMRGSQKGIFSFGKSRATMADPEQNRVTFLDVAGCDEAKDELEEVVEYLKNPDRFSRLGGKVPKGIILLGSPGTGKTLLARAVAGEADVPFFSMSGSDFVEMFVGVGASRVRDLFENGKKQMPCIIFIDEIDAVGRHRGAGLGGGHDEREQTLNQLLVEMDGFEANDGIIVLASTNRPDILDPALLRPGRFDRKVIIDRPDIKGRRMIFELHTKKVKAADDINFEELAQLTPGLVGADIANIVNEAALMAARDGKELVEYDDFKKAKDKTLMGAERRSAVISEQEKRVSAYHESGHALVAYLMPNSDPVHKISIIPRGQALGMTLISPKDDKHLFSREYLKGKIIQLLGGRAAELIVFNEPTSGAQSDISSATEIARNMVCRWGMSDKLGPINYSEGSTDVFIGKDIVTRAHISEKVSEEVDHEVKSIVVESQQFAIDTLKSNIAKLHKLAETLLKQEVVEGNMLDELLGTDANA